IGWTIRREQRVGDSWEVVPGLRSSGIYRIEIVSDSGQFWSFVVAHDADVAIGDHRGGLSGEAWEGIEFSEVSVAAPWPLSTASLPADWQRFHVFLPTREPCPYRLLVNGAFAADLSRQEVRVTAEPDDYNR